LKKETLKLPDYIKSIDSYAFRFTNFSKIEFGLTSQLSNLSSYCFSHMNNLQSVQGFPTFIEDLPSGLFDGCNQLSSLSYGNETLSFGTLKLHI
jgi:hypothetical protein